MDNIQKLVWFGKMLAGSCPEKSKEIAKQEILKILEIRDDDDLCHQISGFQSVLKFLERFKQNSEETIK